MFSLTLALDAVVVGTNATRCSKPGLWARGASSVSAASPLPFKWDMCVPRLTHIAPPTQHAGMTATPDSSMNAMPCGTPFLEKLTRPLSRSNSISMMSPVVYASPYAVKARVPLFCEA